MESLHHHDDCAVDLVIQPRQQRVLVPLYGFLPDGFGLCILGLDRIIDNDDVAASAGEGAPDGVASRYPRSVVRTSAMAAPPTADAPTTNGSKKRCTNMLPITPQTTANIPTKKRCSAAATITATFDRQGLLLGSIY